MLRSACACRCNLKTERHDENVSPFLLVLVEVYTFFRILYPKTVLRNVLFLYMCKSVITHGRHCSWTLSALAVLGEPVSTGHAKKQKLVHEEDTGFIVEFCCSNTLLACHAPGSSILGVRFHAAGYW